MKKKIFYFSTLFITILCLFICIALNDHIYNFNAENVVKNIKYLSSSSFEGRRSGSEENILTSEIIKNKFKDLKLSPYKNSYTEEFITTCPVKTDETVYFKIFNDNESEYLRPLYVGTLIADERGLKELNRKMQIIQIKEDGRRGK